MTDTIVNFALLGAEWVLYLLVLLSIVSIAIMVERIGFFRKRSVDHDALQKEAVRAIRDDRVNTMLSRYKTEPAMAAKVALAGIKAREHGVEAASEAMNSAKISAKEEYESMTVVLGTLGNNAPFIGLFGTVLGIIQAFHDLESNPTGGISAVMGSTSEALVATAVGILVAIPAVVAYNFFGRKIRSHLSHSDALAHAILSAMHSNDRGQLQEDGNSEESDSEEKECPPQAGIPEAGIAESDEATEKISTDRGNED